MRLNAIITPYIDEPEQFYTMKENNTYQVKI